MTHSMIQDVNGNIIANNVLDGYTTTATAAATTTLTVASTYQQFFTGTTTQTVLLPVTSTLILGQSFSIVNDSTGIVTVQSSGANTIQAQIGSTTAIYTCILTSGTTAASWSVTYINNNSGGSGTVNSGTAGQVGYYASSTNAISGGTLQNVLGVAANTASSAGYIGEVISRAVLAASAVSLSSGTPANMTSITLTAGDWDVYGSIGFIGGSGVSFAYCIGSINTTSATMADQSLWTFGSLNTGSATTNSGCALAPAFFRVATTQTVYAVALSSFSVATNSAAGILWGRRRT